MTDTLDDLINDGLLDPQMALKVLAQFDLSVALALKEKVKSRAVLKGHLNVYRFCDDVWTFVVEGVTFRYLKHFLFPPVQTNFRLDNETIIVDKMKVVACSAKN